MKVSSVSLVVAMTILIPHPALPITWQVPIDAPTIQAGIDSASAGDTVRVACGTYYEHDIVMKSGVCLRSENGQPDCVTIDADSLGRVLYCSSVDSLASIEGFTITGGLIAQDGGGVFCESSSPRLRNCTFFNNCAHEGGGVWCGASSPVLTNCTFSRNHAHEGGGLLCSNSSYPTLAFSIFADNSGYDSGGLHSKSYSFPVLTNCTFYNNSTSGSPGGTMFCAFHSSAWLDKTIIASSSQGQAVYCASDSDVTLTCSDVFGNEGGDWVGCIEDQYGNDGNISEDPLFCDPGGGNYRLQPGSPCADAPGCGLIGALPPDCSPPRVWHIFPDGSGDAPTIQAGIDSASAEDTVLVADGTYTGDGNRDIDYNGKPITVRSQSGNPEACVIDCEGAYLHRGFYFHTGEGSASRLEGLTVAHGYHDGAGVYCRDRASPTITNCTFSGGQANGGGGMYCESGSSPTITSCTFAGNWAQSGGGLCCQSNSSPTLTNCTFLSNTATGEGGALRCYFDSDPIVENCTLAYNSAPHGAGTYCLDSSPSFQNTIIAFGLQGQAIECSDTSSSPTFTCSDIYGNAGGDWVGCIADQAGIQGNVSEDPLFCDPENDDLTLHRGSPCAPFSPPNAECDLIGAWPVACGGTLCFEPQVVDTTYHCLTGNFVEIDVTLEGNGRSLGTIGFAVTYESSFFDFVSCSNGELTSGWPPIGCSTTRGEDTVSVFGYCAGADSIPAQATGTLVRLVFQMDCTGLIYGDSVPSLKCITNFAYDCSTFTACECRDWVLTDVVEGPTHLPVDLSLGENYPNPFNPGTTIEFEIPAPGGPVNLSVYDVRGRLVRTLVDRDMQPGRQQAYWDGNDDAGKPVPSGIYFYRLSTPQGVEQRKAVVLK